MTFLKNVVGLLIYLVPFHYGVVDSVNDFEQYKPISHVFVEVVNENIFDAK